MTHRLLGIPSPPRVFMRRVPLVEPQRTPRPWYAARVPGETYESPWMRRQPRLVRRLVRRHWDALTFDPESPIALSVAEAMKHPPSPPEPESATTRAFRLLADLGLVKVDPELADELAKRIGLRYDSA